MKFKSFGYGWAQPVTSRRWAFAATVTYKLFRLTGMGGAAAHRAWERACRI